VSRIDLPQLGIALGAAGFGERDEITFLLHIIASVVDGELDRGCSVEAFFQIADDKELALGNQQIIGLLRRCGLVVLRESGSGLEAIRHPDAKGWLAEVQVLKQMLEGPTEREGQKAEILEPRVIAECIAANARWSRRIVEWCDENQSFAAPVFWSYDAEVVYPLAKAIGSFATCEVALMALEPRRRGDIACRADMHLAEFFGRFLLQYTQLVDDLRGAIAFDQLDDDYPGSSSVALSGRHLSCPVVNSSAQALLVCTLISNSSLDAASWDLTGFLLSSQNADGAWPVHRFADAALCPAQVMSTALSLEALSVFAARRLCRSGAPDLNFATGVLHSIDRASAFLCGRLSQMALVDAAFGETGSEVERMGTTAIALQALLESTCVCQGPATRHAARVVECYRAWRDVVDRVWTPNWANVIRVRVPVPQWEGTFDANQFTWELPLDAVVATLLIDAEIYLDEEIPKSLRSRAFGAVRDTLSFQREGLWRDIPMAVEGTDRGFPQNSQLYIRLLCSFVEFLRKQIAQLDSR
jgi:hypothetical protein